MAKFNRVIFLDEDNTRLSPLASVLFKKKIRAASVEGLNIASRGNIVLFPEPVNQKVVEIAKENDADLSSYAAIALTEEDFSDKTLILALDNASKTKTYDRFNSAVNVYTLKEYLGSNGDLKLPVGGSLEDYLTVIEILKSLLDKLVLKFSEEKEQK